MFRGTTPTYTFTFPDEVDISQANEIYVTFSNLWSKEILTKSGNDLNVVDNSVEVFLDQEETLSFPNGQVKAQLNWLYDDGGVTKRACSQIITLIAERNLIDEEL